MDIQAPNLAAPNANAPGANDFNMESVKIIPGSAAALYGITAINGLANFTTKDPFTSQGINIQQKTGVNHINEANSGTFLGSPFIGGFYYSTISYIF